MSKRRPHLQIVPAQIPTDLVVAGVRTTRPARATEAHYVRLRYGNGGKALTSELYTTKAGAKRAAKAIQDALTYGAPEIVQSSE